MDVVGGKTGFISKSGYCLATLLRLPQSNNQVAFVVLGAQSNPGRFWETRHLFNWLSEKASTLFAKEELGAEPVGKFSLSASLSARGAPPPLVLSATSSLARAAALSLFPFPFLYL